MSIETLTARTAHLSTARLRALVESAERVALESARTEGASAKTAGAWFLWRCYSAILAAR